jgi:DNA-binding winged helix-turn-helix (wHTH) protein
MGTHSRFRFGSFVLSPRRRLLLRDGQPVPLIPKYFDLLLLLIARRNEAVSKQIIFAEVWTDVIVSDGALAQAVRTLRRTLGDDVREPRFIRTISRHGYQFVWPDVREEIDDETLTPTPAAGGVPDDGAADDRAPIEPLIERLLSATDPDEARDAAEQLHTLGTADAVEQLAERPHHARAVAVLRDARWTVPNAGAVPLLRDREAAGAIAALVRLRLADARRTVALRWANAAAAGAVGGAAAGMAGGIALLLAPGSNARPQSTIALAAIGAVAGTIGAAGIGAGLVFAEAVARSRRTLALAACGAVAGATVAAISSVVLRSLLLSLFGLQLAHEGGAADGAVLGGAAGIAYGLATWRDGANGLAAPRGSRRLTVAASVALGCALAGVALALSGRPLVGGLVHEIAQASHNAQLVLGPLGRLIGDPEFGRPAQMILSALEGAAFGAALAWGLTTRPNRGAAQEIIPRS